MTSVDLWALVAAFVAFVSLGLRANMLKPHLATWKTAPDWVWVSVSFLSICFGAACVNIMNGGHANVREAATYTAVAVASTALLVNLALNGRNEPHGNADQAHHL